MEFEIFYEIVAGDKGKSDLARTFIEILYADIEGETITDETAYKLGKTFKTGKLCGIAEERQG